MSALSRSVGCAAAAGAGRDRIPGASRPPRGGCSTRCRPRSATRSAPGWPASSCSRSSAIGGRSGRLDPARRADLLTDLAGSGALAAASVDGLKTLVLLAAGADQFAAEIAETGSRLPPSRPDPELALTPAAELPELVSCDAIVIGSGRRGRLRGPRAGPRRARGRDRRGGRALGLAPDPRVAPASTASRACTATPGRRSRSARRRSRCRSGARSGARRVVNSGTCYRPPEPVVKAWSEEHGLALAVPTGSRRASTTPRARSRSAPAPLEILGRNGELALAGAAELGWLAAPLRRNAPGCRGACQCAIGCPEQRQGRRPPERAPAGLRGGRADRRPGCGRPGSRSRPAARSASTPRRPAGARVRLRAPAVVVACGAIETPPLLRRSGLGRHPRLGRGLSIHPALGVTGSFAEPVYAWRGVMQSVGIEEIHESEGVLLEATASPPGMGAMTIPGFGAELLERLERADHTRGARSDDRRRALGPRPRRSPADRRLPARPRRSPPPAGGAGGVRARAARRRRRPGRARRRDRAPVSDPADLRETVAAIDLRRLRLAAFHPTGTAAAGSDPSRHPVDPEGRLRGADGVWVADASILPSCPGVNPQISIMALAAGVGAAASTA